MVKGEFQTAQIVQSNSFSRDADSECARFCSCPSKQIGYISQKILNKKIQPMGNNPLQVK